MTLAIAIKVCLASASCYAYLLVGSDVEGLTPNARPTPSRRPRLLARFLPLD